MSIRRAARAAALRLWVLPWALRRPGLQDLVREGLARRDGGAATESYALLAELLRLRTVLNVIEIPGFERSFRIRLEYRAVDGALMYRSIAPDDRAGESPPVPGPVRSLTWDHSAIAKTFCPLPRLLPKWRIAMGAQDRHPECARLAFLPRDLS
jgi:hypothetical protein